MPATKNPEDLILKYLKEDESKAFDLLFRRYFHKLFLFTCKHLRDEHQAEDLLMDVMLNFWEKRDRFSAVQNIEAFLYQSVRNKIVDHYRKKAIYTEPIEETTVSLSSPDHTDAAICLQETRKVYLQGLSQLSDQRRKVFELRRHELLSVTEVAEKLDISTKTVENHMTAALTFLRQHLKKSGIAGILLFMIR
ncbi:RNA polymerase sigma-70 factor [Pedobacter sp. SYSU D00535]|uniref:RNA polymerase sigma-70 factor n=1 Tax=Pedobacter sp. SYSU D00535 TaxID=2810308 RepID=UPI001A959F46|nr:RNA polymerase sigma-70 factor [Pedobacter sp. SYSU D00535]